MPILISAFEGVFLLRKAFTEAHRSSIEHFRVEAVDSKISLSIFAIRQLCEDLCNSTYPLIRQWGFEIAIAQSGCGQTFPCNVPQGGDVLLNKRTKEGA